MSLTGVKKVQTGVVVSDKMDKTVVVAVQTLEAHPLYGRRMKRTRKFKAHDPENGCHVGDTVRIEECRPLSREKRWWVREVVNRVQV